MSSIIISQRKVVLHEVSTQTTDKSIWKLIKKYSPKQHSELRRGISYCKNGKELQRIHITLNKLESVNRLMKDRSSLRLNGKQVRVKRSLPNSFPLHDRDVTGIKITINDNKSVGKLNDNDLKKYFRDFGQIPDCKWTNANQTEALFRFADYDLVDRIVLYNPSPKIKGIKINLEKTPTTEDYSIYERPYVIHVTNLPLRVTSEEISTHFKVPISVILLHPCFRSEQSYIADGRSSSEAWIKSLPDEKTAQALAEEKNGTFVRTNKIECKAMLEQIDEEDPELCKHFQNGECPYTMDTCHFKHFSCSKPDTCDNEFCWFGHTQKRTKVSIDRPEYHLEHGQYRVRFSNLPSDITHDSLMRWMKINSTLSKYLILQPSEQNPNSPRMAYLTRQPIENRLRQQIDKWHNTSFSSVQVQKIQCQLEINQEYYEWNDSIDITRPPENSRRPSSVSSSSSTYSSRTSEASSYSSTVSINSWKQNSASKTEQTTNSVPHIRQPPLEPNYFPPPQTTNIPISSPSIPLEDPFVYLVSLIHHLKHQFAVRYSQCVRWSTEQKNHWLSQDTRIEHDDLLIFSYQTKDLPIHIHWNVKMLDDKDFSIDIKAKADENINIELPMGIWKLNEQTTNFDLHFNNFEMKIKMLINIIYQSIAF